MKKTGILRVLRRKSVCVYTGLLMIIASVYKLIYRITNKTRTGKVPRRIILLISRPQDVELLIGLHERAKQRKDILLSFWLLKRCERRSPYVLPLLKENGVVVSRIVGYIPLINVVSELIRSDVFLSTVEYTAKKAKLPYVITRMANAAGLSTYRLQHGFENIGLTYRDEVRGPEVEFASRTVLTWGPTDELPAWVSRETRDKAIAVGCPKELAIIENNPSVEAGERTIIGIFENLHWHRYDKEYRSAFFRDLKAVSQRRKEFRFILKSHPGSVLKRDSEFVALLRSLDNVAVADMVDEESLTTPWLLSHATGVITTPSTIAVDGALAGIPVAVTGYGLDLGYYSPLTLLDDLDGWQGFLDRLTDKSANGQLKLKGELFLKRVLVPGDPSTRILDLMSGHK